MKRWSLAAGALVLALSVGCFGPPANGERTLSSTSSSAATGSSGSSSTGSTGASSSGSVGTSSSSSSSSSSGAVSIAGGFTNITVGDGGVEISGLAITGTNVVAVGSTYFAGIILTSSDLGVSFTDVTPPSPMDAGWPAWTAVAANADGSKVFSAQGDGSLWGSLNAASTWTQLSVVTDGGNSADSWYGIAVDASGNRVTATAAYSFFQGPRGIFTSNNSGASWIDATPSAVEQGNVVAGWTSIAADSTGNDLVAVSTVPGDVIVSELWTSSNGGGTWTQQANPQPANPTYPFVWGDVCSDASGSLLLGSAEAGGIYLSTNSGMSWTRPALPAGSQASGAFGPCAESADGAHLLVGGLGEVFTSDDSGSTWTLHTELGSNFAANAVAISADGSARLVAGQVNASNIRSFQLWKL